MNALMEILKLLVGFASSVYIMIVVVRFLLQVVRADFYNPLSQFIVKVTNPLLMPLRKVIPGFAGIDMASIVLALVLQLLSTLILTLIGGNAIDSLWTLLTLSVFSLLMLLLNIYLFSLIIIAIVSWIAPQTYNPAVNLLSSITEPVLRPIRNQLPASDGLDFSVMVAVLLILILRIIVDNSFGV